MIKEIGGYFELELGAGILPSHFANAKLVNSARNALELLLVSVQNIQRLWIPYFTCEVILEPLAKLNIPYSFYHINAELEIASELKLKENEYLLYTNYFGIKDNYTQSLNDKYGDKLIIDNAQALYHNKQIKGAAIYSFRKYVGVPDGGALVYTHNIDMEGYERDCSYQRSAHLLKRADVNAAKGYKDFTCNDNGLTNQPIRKISNLSSKIIESIDFKKIQNTRQTNFQAIHSVLAKSNRINIDRFGDFACPMVYPYLTTDKSLKQYLIDNKIFVATYWPNVIEWCQPTDLEYQLVNGIIPIPIDQRYTIEDMNYITNKILSKNNEN